LATSLKEAGTAVAAFTTANSGVLVPSTISRVAFTPKALTRIGRDMKIYEAHRCDVPP